MHSKKTYLVLLILPLLSFTAHKYYLSLTQIKYKKEVKSIQVIINVFMDDIEEALNKDFKIDLQLTTKDELKNNDVYFEKYLNQKLEFKVNNNQEKFNYVGKEYDGDLVYFYLEIKDIENINSINVINNILTNHFPKQQNLIKSKVGTTYKSVLLTKDKNSAQLKY